MNKPVTINKPFESSVLQLEQAIYGSQRSALKRGYHILAKSQGVSGETVTELNRWCPSHGSLFDDAPDAWSLNFHPIGSDLFALSRTVYGTREFSNRGGLQVVTMVLILNRQQLSHYGYNPFAIARVARSWGLLRWTPSISKALQPVRLPSAAASESKKTAGTKWPYISTAVKAVDAGGSVALTSSHPSLDMLESLFLQLPCDRRLQFSFTSGLKPSPQRPFRLHLLKAVNSRPFRLLPQNLQIVAIPDTLTG